MKVSSLLRLRAAVPPNYSNTPYKKVVVPPPRKTPNHSNRSFLLFQGSLAPGFTLGAPALLSPSGVPSQRQYAGNGIRESATRNSDVGRLSRPSFRSELCNKADITLRQELFLAAGSEADADSRQKCRAAAQQRGRAGAPRWLLGERLRDALECRWAAKFYGNVTYGPRNYPYQSSRWLARRFQMKKHRILKRMRFRRYKLAAVANLPFAKMIRVGMLPELKSSKSKKGDTVDASLSSHLVQAAKGHGGAAGAGGGRKSKGKRSRPKSKYQV